ncbi:MAG: RHS repeat-associated core domain-containing protein, partial [Armatimonadetes bacterium]|nr:RHS repeat-associated core domain-containing protein [Armatimonadota bacterium]
SVSGTTTNRFRYIGKLGYYLEPALGCYYLRRRYYVHWLGRFLSKDPLRQGGENAYGYVGNSPTRGVDPSGMAWTFCDMMCAHLYGSGYYTDCLRICRNRDKPLPGWDWPGAEYCEVDCDSDKAVCDYLTAAAVAACVAGCSVLGSALCAGVICGALLLAYEGECLANYLECKRHHRACPLCSGEPITIVVPPAPGGPTTGPRLPRVP